MEHRPTVHEFYQPYQTYLDTSITVDSENQLLPVSALHKAQGCLDHKIACQFCRRRGCRLRSHRQFALHMAQKAQQRASAPLKQLDEEKADPFARHPIRMTPQLEGVYRQFFAKWNTDFRGPERHIFPFSRYRTVLEAAPNDSTCFLALLSLVSTQLSVLRYGKVDEDTLKLQNEVICSQMMAVPRDGPSDARILTALIVMSNAIALNGAAPLGPHLETISGFLKQRGGIMYLGMGGVISDNLQYADHYKAVIYNTMPRYSVPTPPFFCPAAPKHSPKFEELLRLDLISADVCTACCSLNVLVKIYDRGCKGMISASECTYFGYLGNVSEYQLAMANFDHHTEISLDICLVLAHLLINHILLRNNGSVTSSIMLIEERLWNVLDKLREHDFFRNHSLRDLEYYLVCVGGIVHLRRPSSSVKKSARLLQEMRDHDDGETNGTVKTFHDLCNIMEEYGWSENVCVTAYARIWNQRVDGHPP